MSKSSKLGRNKVKCAKYRSEGRREKNKARKAARRQRKLAKRKEAKASSAAINMGL
jgi:hypothetical protein